MSYYPSLPAAKPDGNVLSKNKKKVFAKGLTKRKRNVILLFVAEPKRW